MLEAVGDRLRAERVRLNFDQRSFAPLGGVSKNSQLAYEQGKTAPAADYLLRIAEHGVDIAYVLTGYRTTGRIEGMEKVLLDLWNQLSAREREAVMQLLLTLTGRVVTVEQLSMGAAAAAKVRAEIEGLPSE